MLKCCGYGRCTGAPGCTQRNYRPTPPKDEPDCALKSDPIFGWFLIIMLSALLVIPFAVISKEFGDTAGPIIFLLLTFGFPAWAILKGFEPFDKHKM